MRTLRSTWVYLVLNFQRVSDHLWRHYSGLPMLKRSKITPHIFLGGQFGPKSVTTFKKLGITGVVNMRMTPFRKDPAMQHLSLLHLPTPDHEAPSLKDLEKGVTFIQKQIDAGGNVYVHCHYGEGRGPSMVIAYLISQGMTYDDAYEFVRKIRTFIKPTPPQIMRLREFEQTIKA